MSFVTGLFITGLFTRVVAVIRTTRELLAHPGSPTGKAVSIWAKVMVLPQFLLAPFTLLIDRWEGPAIFIARFVAMHIAYVLEQKMPFSRAIGICHLVAFGPLFVWFTINFSEIYAGWGVFGPGFTAAYIIIGICLYLDLRDLLLHLSGRPFPCYVRDYHRLGVIQVEDQRVNQPVTPFSIFFW